MLEITKLYKRFGENEVIRGLDMSVPEHSVFGFVGQNGAGKTTTMKMVLGLLHTGGGEIRVCGEKVVYGKTNRAIGYLPDVPEFYGYLKPMEYLTLCGQISTMSAAQIRTRSTELLELVGLSGIKRRIGAFSRGMKQRLGIAQALLNEPRLLLCDEPTSALDPVGRKEILEILSSLRGKTTVVFSTHILSDVERICDRVAVLNGGKLALCGTLSEIKGRHGHDAFMIEFASEGDAARFAALDALRAASISVEQSLNTVTVKVADANSGGALLIGLLAQNNLTPSRFEIMEPTLESLFLEALQ
jgi:ABC-2 type transport system ATP-binding protein